MPVFCRSLLEFDQTQAESDNDYIVFDAANRSFVLSRETQVPAYEDRFEYEGTEVFPAIELLKKSDLGHLGRFPYHISQTA